LLTETEVHVNMKFVQLWSRDLQIYLTMITYYIKPRHRLHACCIGWHSWKAITNSLSCLNHSHGKRKTSSTPWTSTDPIALRSNGLTPKGGGGGGRRKGEEKVHFTISLPVSASSKVVPTFWYNTAQSSKTSPYSLKLPSSSESQFPPPLLPVSRPPIPSRTKKPAGVWKTRVF